MKRANYNYIDEAGSHQKWKHARRIHLIPPSSTNWPSVQTREPPPVARRIVVATAAEAWGPQRREHTQGTAPASLFRGGCVGLMGDLGAGWDTCRVDPEESRVCRRVPGCHQPPLRLENLGWPDAVGGLSGHFLMGRLI